MIVGPNEIALFLGYTNFTDSTVPNYNQVNTLIDMIESELLTVLKMKNIYINLNDENIKKLLKKYIIFGVSGLILNTFLNNNQNEGTMANFYKQKYNDFLEKPYFLFKEKISIEGMD